MPDKFKIISMPGFERDFKKLLKRDKKIEEIFDVVVEILRVDPFNRSRAHDIKKLTDIKEGEGGWRIRRGNYRFRYDVEGNRVILHHAKDRKDSY